MSGGLLALLDDVVALAKVAAASLDDVAAQAVKAGSKAAGIVIDDAAVTPRYVVGFAAARELPIVMRIAWGSLKNKMLYLLPAALVLSAFAPWAITPLLMFGGAYLCFEGYEKVAELLDPATPAEGTGDNAAKVVPGSPEAKAFEDQRVAGAIRTDMILSAEIMAISLAAITEPSLIGKAVILAGVAALVTAGVYGAVALIVKADDIGVALAQEAQPMSRIRALLSGGVRGPASGEATPRDLAVRPYTQAIGRALVRGMPPFLKGLSLVGTLAMLWVGGGIIVHGLAQFGWSGLEHAIHAVGHTLGDWIPLIGGLVSWLIGAALSGLVGLAVGWAVAKLLTLAGLGHGEGAADAH